MTVKPLHHDVWIVKNLFFFTGGSYEIRLEGSTIYIHEF